MRSPADGRLLAAGAAAVDLPTLPPRRTVVGAGDSRVITRDAVGAWAIRSLFSTRRAPSKRVCQ